MRKRENGKVEQMTKLVKNSLFGDTIKKDLVFKHEFKINRWMDTDYDVRVEENRKLEIGGYISKLEKNEEIDDDDFSKTNRRPSHFRAFI